MLQCQPGQLTRKYLLFSVLAHLVLILIVAIAASLEGKKKSFVVFGVHSSKHSLAYFKPLLAPKQKVTRSAGRLTKKKPVLKRSVKKRVIKKKVTAPRIKPLSKPKLKLAQKAKPKPRPVKKITPKPKPVPKPVQKVEETLEELTSGEPLTINLAEGIDPKLMRYYKELQKEVGRLWRPPVGVPKGTECVLSMQLDSVGKIKSFELKEKSKVMIYDMSVLQAAKEFKLSKPFWSNSLIITFRQ